MRWPETVLQADARLPLGPTTCCRGWFTESFGSWQEIVKARPHSPRLQITCAQRRGLVTHTGVAGSDLPVAVTERSRLDAFWAR